MEVVNYHSPVGNFYMIIDNGLVIETGFGNGPSLPEAKNRIYKDFIDDYFNGDSGALDKIKYKNQRGSDFSKKVWQAMSQIPYGHTVSYADIAKKIGQPKAVRAVGGACGRNKLPLLIPCHRVVKSDGSLGNYAYGPKIKKLLLNLENIDNNVNS